MFSQQSEEAQGTIQIFQLERSLSEKNSLIFEPYSPELLLK